MKRKPDMEIDRKEKVSVHSQEKGNVLIQKKIQVKKKR